MNSYCKRKHKAQIQDKIKDMFSAQQTTDAGAYNSLFPQSQNDFTDIIVFKRFPPTLFVSAF